MPGEQFVNTNIGIEAKTKGSATPLTHAIDSPCILQLVSTPLRRYRLRLVLAEDLGEFLCD